MTVVIDAHQHFWDAASVAEQSWRDPAHTVLDRSYLPADLAPRLAAAGVDRTVLMQAADNRRENHDLARYAADAGFVAGVVAWLPLADPDRAGAELDALAGVDLPLCGVRCLIGTDPLAWATRPAALARFRDLATRGLCWDVVPVTPAQVEAVCAVASAVPELRIVVDHLARPPVDTGHDGPWRRAVDALAERPNVAVKLSVGVDLLSRWRAWDPAALRPYLAHALERFGPRRAMLASNWPVCLLRVGYATAWADLAALVAELAPDERDAVTGGTAALWYGLVP